MYIYLSLLPSNCFLLSVDAKGNDRFFLRSVRAIKATSSSSWLTIGNLPDIEAAKINDSNIIIINDL